METTDKVLESHRSLLWGAVKYMRQGIDIVKYEISSAIDEMDNGDIEAARDRLEWVLKAMKMWEIKEDPSGLPPQSY